MRIILSKAVASDKKSTGYKAIRRDIDRIYIPTEYYTMRKTRKELFMMTLKRAIDRANKESE